jgi:hypothetical protein
VKRLLDNLAKSELHEPTAEFVEAVNMLQSDWATRVSLKNRKMLSETPYSLAYFTDGISMVEKNPAQYLNDRKARAQVFDEYKSNSVVHQ